MTNVVIMTIALTIASEAANDTYAAKAGIADVIYWEARGKNKSFYTVCRNQNRYRGWRKGYKKLKTDFCIPGQKEWEDCVSFARRLVEGKHAPAMEATNFCSEDDNPSWVNKMRLVKTEGKTRFFIEHKVWNKWEREFIEKR